MSLEIDTTQFHKAMRTYMKATKRTLPEVINNKAYFVVRNAMKRTRKADVKKIRAFFRKANRKEWLPYVVRFLLNTGKTGRGMRPTEAEIQAGMKKLKGMRAKSVAYLRAGWIPALRAFSKAAKGKATSRRMVAYMSNTIGRGSKEHAKAIKFWAKPALQHAFRDESRSFRKFAIRRLKARFRVAHSKFKMS